MKRYKDIKGDAGSNIVSQVTEQKNKLHSALSKIGHKIAVMSGKGGVGKSAVTVNLACSFAKKGLKVGIVDADINSPSIAMMMGIHGQGVNIKDDHAYPNIGPLGVKIMSMDIFLPDDKTPVIWNGPKGNSFVWRGTMEATTLREFISDVEWGALDILFIDVPPGTDRFSNIAGMLPELEGAIIVTIPSEVSQLSVNKSISYAKDELNSPIIGLIENMGGFVCQKCGNLEEIFHSGNAKHMANESGIDYLGKIPFDKKISVASDKGVPYVINNENSTAGKVFTTIMKKTEEFLRIAR